MKKENKGLVKKNFSIIQIAILLLSIFAFAYLTANNLPIFSASEKDRSSGGSNEPIGKLPVKELSKYKFSFDIPLPKLNSVEPVILERGDEGGVSNALEEIFLKLGAGWKTLVLVSAATFVISFAIAMFTFEGDAAKAAARALRTTISAVPAATALALGASTWVVAPLAILGYFIYKWLGRETDRQINFNSRPWKPQIGGANCELCNNGPLPCTLYQCKSLGTACEIINKDTDNQKCVWNNSRDVNPPTITPWREILTEGFRYDPITPPPRGGGVYIKYGNQNCLPAYTPFRFGVELDKEGYCRIELNRTQDFSDMRFDFGGLTDYIKKHRQWIIFPGVVHLEEEAARRGMNITVGKDYEFYVRCESVNGKSNTEEFLFKFCIDDGPDNTAPRILGFNWRDNAPVAWFNETAQREVPVEVYTNEPAKCKWDFEDKDYDEMENNLTSSSLSDIFNGQLSYINRGKLTGLINGQTNRFYFRCRDYFNNTNAQSRVLTLRGTESLFIRSASPNETTIRGATSPIKVTLNVETGGGADQGAAVCTYKESSTGISGAYLTFTTTGTNQHSTNIYLSQGSYNYYVRCSDQAGNSDIVQINFNVETDTSPPIITRVFREAGSLKVTTSEEGSCVYSTTESLACEYNFDRATNMTRSANKLVHSTNWDPTKTFYIKCQDEFENRPISNQCSIIVKPFGN